MKTIFKPLMLATVLVTAGFLGACNDNNPTTPTATATPTPSPAATPEPTTSPSPEPTPGPEPGVGDVVGFLGIVRDIDIPGNTLNVSSKTVMINSSTQYVLEDGSPWSLAAVQIGDHVRVRGRVRADGGTDLDRLTKLAQ